MIKDVPIPQVKDDEVLLKGLPSPPTQSYLGQLMPLSSSHVWFVSSPCDFASGGCRYHGFVGVCGTDGHIHEGEFTSTFPVCMRARVGLKSSYLPFEQLIPGHEAVGSIVELGKDVKDFAIGDRCVADVGVTVSAVVIYGSLISHH